MIIDQAALTRNNEANALTGLLFLYLLSAVLKEALYCQILINQEIYP